MPTELILTGGERLQVTASFQEVRDAIASGRAIATTRFAGFRGTDVVGAEDVLVLTAALAAVVDIAAP
jgi:hypothetical protein